MQSVVHTWSVMRLPSFAASVKRYYDASARMFSLEGLLGGAKGRLRAEAQTLHLRLEQCLACLLDV